MPEDGVGEGVLARRFPEVSEGEGRKACSEGSHAVDVGLFGYESPRRRIAPPSDSAFPGLGGLVAVEAPDRRADVAVFRP